MSTQCSAIFSHTTQANEVSHLEYTLQNQYKQREKQKSTHFVFFGWLKELDNSQNSSDTEVEYTKLKISKNLLILQLAEFSKFIQTIWSFTFRKEMAHSRPIKVLHCFTLKEIRPLERTTFLTNQAYLTGLKPDQYAG